MTQAPTIITVPDRFLVDAANVEIPMQCSLLLGLMDYPISVPRKHLPIDFGDALQPSIDAAASPNSTAPTFEVPQT
jgi:hypothetical protein